MPDGSITFSTELDNKELEKELAGISKKIDKLEAKLYADKAAKMPLQQKAEELVVQLDAAKAKLEEMKRAASGSFSASEIADQNENVKSLQARWNEAQTAVERYDAKISKTTSEIEYQKNRYGELSATMNDKVNPAAGETGRLFGEAENKMGKLVNRVTSLAKSVFVFSLITTALKGMRAWMGKAIKTNREASAAIAQLKGALLTLAQPIVNVVIPAFTALVNVLTMVITVISSVVSKLFGMTIDKSAEAAENLYDETEALEGVGSAAKKAGKQLAGFDEINKLSNEGESGGGVSSTIMPDFDAIKEFKLPDWLEDFTTSLMLTVDDVLFNWDNLNGEQIAEKAIAGLTAIAGAVAGFTIGGVPGALLGTLGGLVLGLVINTLTFDHDGFLSEEEILKMIVIAISGIVGAGLGFALTHSAKGTAIGLMIGAIVGLIINSMTFDSNGKISRAEVMRLIRMALLEILGGVIGVVVGGATGAAIGIAIGITLSLIVNSFEIEHDENIRKCAEGTELGKLVSASLEGSAAALEAAADLKVHIESITGEISEEKLADIERAKKLIDEIFEIDSADNKTAGQLTILRDKINELNGMGLEGVSIGFDEATGHVVGTKEAVQDVIGALLKQYQMEALHDAYVEQFKNQYQAEQDVKKATDELKKATENYTAAVENAKAAEEEYNKAADAFSKVTSDHTVEHMKAANAFDAARTKLQIANEVVDEARTAQDQYAEALRISLDNYDQAKTSVADLQAAYEELVISTAKDTEAAKDGGKDIMKGTAEGIDDGYTVAEETIVNAHKALQDAADAVDGIHSPSTVYAEHGKYMMMGLAKGIEDNAYQPENALRAVCNNLIAIAQKAMDNIVSAFNSVARSVNATSYNTGIEVPSVSKVSIPMLAQGAVIPPNREFMAVLGDQKSGTNIETPLATMVQAFKQAMSESGMGCGGNRTIILTLDRRELGRAVVDVYGEETRRVGVKLGGMA